MEGTGPRLSALSSRLGNRGSPELPLSWRLELQQLPQSLTCPNVGPGNYKDLSDSPSGAFIGKAGPAARSHDQRQELRE